MTSTRGGGSSTTTTTEPAVKQKPAVIPERSEDQRLLDIINAQGIEAIEELSRLKRRPIQTKRKTLYDQLAADTTSVSMLKIANATYVDEINKYNVGFTPIGSA